jgi:hypothetical protein
MSDICHDQILDKINWTPTQINSLTASTPAAIRTPVHFGSDRECLEKIWPTVGRFDPRELRIAWIPNSLEIATLALSESLRAEIESNPELEVLGSARDLTFDAEGNLPQCAEFTRVGESRAQPVH